MGKRNYHEHLDYILENTTAYQRMIWLKKALDFWKCLQKENRKQKKM